MDRENVSTAGPLLGDFLLRALRWQRSTGQAWDWSTPVIGTLPSYLENLARQGFLIRLPKGSYLVNEHNPEVMEEFRRYLARPNFKARFRQDPDLAQFLQRALRYQRTTGRPWRWSNPEINVLPRYLDEMVAEGLLERPSKDQYRVSETDLLLIQHLSEFVAHELPGIRRTQARMLAQMRAHRQAVRSERARALRAAEEKARMEEGRRRALEDAARRKREQSLRAAELEARRAAEKQRVWDEGSPEEIRAVFGTSDESILHLLRRGFPRRRVVTGLHVGEHRVSRVGRKDARSGTRKGTRRLRSSR